MKRTLTTLIFAAVALVGAGAKSAVELRTDLSRRLFFSDLMRLDTLQLDTLYDFWNDYVNEYPKNELSWRNLYEISHALKFKNDKQKYYVMGRMEQAIPDSYTFNYCAYDSYYEFAKYPNGDKFAERAIELLPEDSPANDYERWITYLYREKFDHDTTQLTNLLTRYFEKGYYPAAALQYHFNELQGMDEGAVYLGIYEGDIIGKLILQLVKGVHCDKILYCETNAHNRPYLEALFRRIGLPVDFFNLEGLCAQTSEQKEELLFTIRYICEHSMRSVYTSANCIQSLIRGDGLPDDLKGCFYNEGLTMHYSATPYDNKAVKRRNVEERYRLEYLRLSFQPSVNEKTNTLCFTDYSSIMAFNYLLLFYDLMPYYKAYSSERHAWLNSLFTDILTQMRKNKLGGFSLNGRFFGIEASEEGGFHYEVREIPIEYVREDPRDDEATRQKRKANSQLLLKTEPIE